MRLRKKDRKYWTGKLTVELVGVEVAEVVGREENESDVVELFEEEGGEDEGHEDQAVTHHLHQPVQALAQTVRAAVVKVVERLETAAEEDGETGEKAHGEVENNLQVEKGHHGQAEGGELEDLSEGNPDEPGGVDGQIRVDEDGEHLGALEEEENHQEGLVDAALGDHVDDHTVRVGRLALGGFEKRH